MNRPIIYKNEKADKKNFSKKDYFKLMSDKSKRYKIETEKEFTDAFLKDARQLRD